MIFFFTKNPNFKKNVLGVGVGVGGGVGVG